LLRFSYRLDGGPWSPFSGNRIATFRGTPIGKHEFEVVALDRSGNIDPSSARFAFTVLTPWYFTAGFMEIVSLTLVTIVYLVWLAVRHVAQLKKLATRDGLTSEWNRRAIFQLLATELEQAKRKSGSVAVIMIDVDEFKRINDKYGHPVGDQVLREVARRLRSGTRASDQLGRYGGEEFLIILPNCGRLDAIARAEALRRTVERQSISVGVQNIDITCSFGVTGTKQDSYDLQQLLREADAALYEAKQSGRNRVGAAPDPLLANAALGG
jgi:diguanylate cyclase (GGDEF)-like protein